MSDISSESPKRPFVRLYLDELEDARRLALPDHLQAIHLLLLVHSVREDRKQPWTKGRDGEVLISVEDLAALRDCSTSTIRRAYRTLIQQGFCCRKNGKLSVLRVAAGAAPDAQIDDLGAARDARRAAPDAQEAARDAHRVCISCRPADAEDRAFGSYEASAGETGNASDRIQEDHSESDSLISHCGTATAIRTSDDDEVDSSLDEERRHEDDDTELEGDLPQHSLRQVAVGSDEPPATPAIERMPHDTTTASRGTTSQSLSSLDGGPLPSPSAPQVPVHAPRRDEGGVVPPPTPAAPPAVVPLERADELEGDSGRRSSSSATLQVATSGGITVESYLTETVGVSESGVEEILALGIDDLRIRQASVFALARSNRNPAAYLRSCLRDPFPTFWADARRAWTAKRDALQSDIDAVIRQHGLFARQSVATSLGISDTDVFVFDLTFDDGMTLEAAMVEMYLGWSAGAFDNEVLGGVDDFYGSAPAVRLLANYGESLTRAFLAAVGQASIPIPPELEQRVGDATERFPVVPETFDGQTISESVSAAEAAERERKLKREAEAEQKRRRLAAEEAEARLRVTPGFHRLPKDQGLILEMGQVLEGRGPIGVLAEYGVPVSWEFLRTMYQRIGETSKRVEELITTVIHGLLRARDHETLDRIVERTGDLAPYPEAFSLLANEWTRYWPSRRGPSIPVYGDGLMRDYTSLTDGELTEDWFTPHHDEPVMDGRRTGKALW